jgi:hypothetical protein
MINNKIYIIGGENHIDFKKQKDIYFFDINDNNFYKVVEKNQDFCDYSMIIWHSCVSINNIIYLFGGVFEKNNFNQKLLKFHNEKWEEIKIKSEKNPKERIKFAMNRINERYFLIFGGKNKKNLNDLWIFDLEKSIWIEIDQKNTPPCI